MRPTLYKLGNLDLWLDAGSMFGIVPKPIWSKRATPDEQNRMGLGLNPLLVRAGERFVLIETGIDRKPGKFRRIYGLSETNPLLDQLALGVQPQDISLVIHTRLHFDHAGLNTRLVEGRLLPTFPNAQHIVQKQELEDALHPHRSQASYRIENAEPLVEHRRFEVVEGGPRCFRRPATPWGCR